MRAGILGGGVWGRTLAWRIAKAGHEATIWSRDPERVADSVRADAGGDEAADRITAVGDLPAALEPDLVLIAVPPAAVRELTRQASPHLRPEQAVVHVVKGLEAGGATISQVVEQETLVLRTGALAGPWVADELAAGDDTAAVVGSRHQSVVDDVTALLASPQVRVYGTLDLVGVEVGGAMRTPMAIASGFVRGANLGRSLSAVLLTRGIAEAARLAEAMGGLRPTVSGLSGIGDWMLTTTDADDALVGAGMAVARGEPFTYEEGASRVRTLVALSDKLGVDMPITESVGAILDGMPLAEVLADLMTREQRPEVE